MPKLLRRGLSPGRTLAPPPSQVTVRIRRSGQEQPEELPCEQISDVLPLPDVLLWVDIQDPGPAELEMLRQEFEFSPLSLEDAGKRIHRPKVDEYPDYYFLVMYAPLGLPRPELRTVEINLFVGKNYIVSLHNGPVPAMGAAFRRWEVAHPDLRDRVGFLAHMVVDTIVDAYFPVADDIDDRLDKLDVSLFQSNSTANPAELLALKRSLFTLRKAIYPLREVFEAFPQDEDSLFDLETHPYFEDVYDHVLRLLDTVDIQRDMITGALDAHLAFVSNRLNETMKTLTVVGICEAAAGAVFGAWGVNVKGIPFNHVVVGHTEVGFWLVWAIALAVIGVALLWLKRREMW